MDFLTNTTAGTSLPISLTTLAINLLLSIVLSSIVGWFYARFGKSLSNRGRFAQNLPALSATTVLLITIVQSSLTLSLGLVGAFSIVRFRTAIKEPEELAHLFLSIAIGLGIGANQRIPTIIAIAVILAYLLIRSLLSMRIQKNNLYFNLVTTGEADTFEKINQIVRKHVGAASLRRLDNTTQILQATYILNVIKTDTIIPLMDELRTTFPDCELSFVEQNDMLTA